jgi:hypothetical protein
MVGRRARLEKREEKRGEEEGRDIAAGRTCFTPSSITEHFILTFDTC